ncbi:MAG: pseudaminic acid cytidylyltransferase [Helicobacteraceae bacterium]|jgi:N-acylneuraminate cytidylyltransferase|nr:pseudaminic acid cytidylyltransferase [Helicobacteraceae bacterium]
MKNIAVIPARGGSKRIERKNIRSFCGQPIIAYSIQEALASRLFDEVVVSTDDAEIAAVSREFGAFVPFIRPRELSDDFTGVIEVVSHAIERVGGAEYACLIYATAPFLRSADLIGASEMMGENDYVLSIAEYEAPIFRAVRLDKSGCVLSIWKKYEKYRSQDLPRAFFDAAHFCFGRAEAFLLKRSIFNGRTAGYIIDRTRAQDIDTPKDWQRAEAMFRTMRNEDRV